MAIDYDAIKKAKEEELKKQLDTPISMKPIEEAVAKSREDFLGRTGISGAALGEATQMPTLQRKTESQIAQKGYDINRQRREQTFNELMNLAIDRGQSLSQAKEFAYNVMSQQQEQDWKAGESAKDRALNQRLTDMGGRYSEQGIALADQYQPDYDPTGAIMRMLLGTGMLVGTSSYLNKGLQQPTQTSQNYNLPYQYGGTRNV